MGMISKIVGRFYYKVVEPVGLLRRCLQSIRYRHWIIRGRKVPPPSVVKRVILRRHARLFALKLFVETGTFEGRTTQTLRHDFERLYTIELSAKYHALASKRLVAWPFIYCIHGNSGDMLKEIIPVLDKPTLFWLDSHYSGLETAMGREECPIFHELKHILRLPSKGNVLLIDDAREFGTNPAYPTLTAVEALVRSSWPSALFEVKDDIIRVLPATGTTEAFLCQP